MWYHVWVLLSHYVGKLYMSNRSTWLYLTSCANWALRRRRATRLVRHKVGMVNFRLGHVIQNKLVET